MRNTRAIRSKYSRREFLATSALLSMPALGAGFANGAARAAKKYRVVPGWPQQGVPQVQTRGIDADRHGRIYVSGDEQHPVLMISAEGKYLGDWGGDVLVAPHGVRVQHDTVWVTDVQTHQAHQFTLDGKLIRSFGQKGSAGDAPEQFNKPTDFAFGPEGSIYISDGYVNTRVVCRAPDGTIRRIWGEQGNGPGQFSLVHAIAIDRGGRVYVGDRNNDRVQIFDLAGKYLTEWKHVGKPYGLYAHANGTIFLCGVEPASGKFRVLILNRDGQLLDEFGETGAGPGQFLMAHSLYVDQTGGVVVADGKANRVQKFTPADIRAV